MLSWTFQQVTGKQTQTDNILLETACSGAGSVAHGMQVRQCKTVCVCVRTAFRRNDIGGLVNPTAPHLSSQPSPVLPPQMASLEYLQKHNIMKMFSEFRIKGHQLPRTSINGHLGHLQDYNLFVNPILDADIDLERLIVQYFRQCPPHQNDQRMPTSSCVQMRTDILRL